MPGLEHCGHLLMDQVDSLQRSNKNLELYDLPRVVPLDHVDSVDDDAVYFHLELQRSVTWSAYFSNVFEGLIEKDVEGSGKVLSCHSLSDLRRVDDGRVKDHVIGEKCA